MHFDFDFGIEEFPGEGVVLEDGASIDDIRDKVQFGSGLLHFLFV